MAKSAKTEEQKIVVTSSTETLASVITLMERIKKFIDQYGLKGTFTSLLVLFVAGVMGFFIINPDKAFQAFERFSEDRHNELIKARMDADPYIRNYLNSFKEETSADRVFILETHNGGSNLSNLPFLYVDMTYAEPSKVLSEYGNDYQNIRLTRYPIASIVYNNGYWIGPLEDIIELDPELYYRLSKEDVKYIGMMLIYGKNSIPSGVLGVVFTCDDDLPSIGYTIKELQKYTNVVSPLLNKNN